MRFIETLFGFSPDNNSGMAELAILLALLALILAIVFRRRQGDTENRGCRVSAQSLAPLNLSAVAKPKIDVCGF